MTFKINSAIRQDVTSHDGTQITLHSPKGASATIYPALGFNCYSWIVPSSEGNLDILYQDPELFPDGRPTRSGIPVLFPYPNRVRDAHFTWEGKSYSLPRNDNIKKHNIHGFAVRNPWRVIDQGADLNSAWVTGEFQISKDDPASVACWPADAILQLTYRLKETSLGIEALVINPDSKPLPFGLGYHPYFNLPFTPGLASDDCSLQCGAKSFWHLDECLPDGRKIPVDAARDLNKLRKMKGFQADDVLTDLPAFNANAFGMMERGRVQGAKQHAMVMYCDNSWRDMVVFTPGSRTSVCIEPYTCVTDAINLQQKGIDAGLLILPPSGKHQSLVELRIEPCGS